MFDVQHLSATVDLRNDLWKQRSTVLLDLCGRIGTRRRISEVRALRGFLEARLTLLRVIPGLSVLPGDAPRMADVSSRLETTLLVSLCTSDVDVYQTVMSCIALALEEFSLVEAHGESTRSLSSVLRNHGVYQELVSPDFRFTGQVAFQKRMRALLRRMPSPTAGILNAWEAAFNIWIHLARDVSTSTSDGVDDKTFSEWRNLSGFLASLGGVCTAGQGTALEEPALGDLCWIDQHCSGGCEEPALVRFLRLGVQLLGCSNVKVREATRDVLSAEVSPRLYRPLFKALESELEVLLAGALAPADYGHDGEIVFAEQSASMLKTLVERVGNPSDLGAASSVYLGVPTLNFTKFIDGAPDRANTLRVKVRICNYAKRLPDERSN